MRLFYYLLMLCVSALFFFLGFLNQVKVPFNYVLGSTEIHLIWIMFAAFAFGALLGMLVFGFRALFWQSYAKSLVSRMDEEVREQRHQAVRQEFEAEQSN